MPRLPSLPRSALGALALPALLAAAPGWAADAPAPVNVTVTDKGCEPSTLTVPAGKTAFKIKNASKRTLEWEILQGVKVVEERENIAPGFSATLTANLSAGAYQMTCGLLSNPKGTLTVTGGGAAAAAKPAVDLTRQIAEYKTYVIGETDALVAATAKFVAAIKAGNLEEAQKLYAPARVHYERIEPIAELFDDLDGAMDARVDDFEKKEKDPKWTGFHRIERVLFIERTTKGLDSLADKLAADTTELRKRLDTLDIPAQAMVGGAGELIEEVAAKKIAGEEDRYSRTDLWDFQANIDGAQEIWGLVKPMIVERKPALATRIDDQFAKVDTILTKYTTADGGFKSYDALSKADRNALKGPITVLAEDLSQLRGILGVE